MMAFPHVAYLRFIAHRTLGPGAGLSWSVKLHNQTLAGVSLIGAAENWQMFGLNF